MLKLRLLLRRIRSFSFGRMLVYVREVKKETRTPSLLIVLDMLLCIVLYNVGFFDYHIFGFVHIRRHRDRRTFFTMRDNWRLCRLVNAPKDAEIFQDKIRFCNTFSQFLGREYLDLHHADDKALDAFLHRHPVVFLKRPAASAVWRSSASTPARPKTRRAHARFTMTVSAAGSTSWRRGSRSTRRCAPCTRARSTRSASSP